MRRRELITLASGAIALHPWVGRAQPRAMPVVGFLAIAEPVPFAPFLAAFHQGLGDTWLYRRKGTSRG